MLFFWRQPTYQSGLDLLLKQLAKNSPALPDEKEAGLKRLWDREPFDPENHARMTQSRLPCPANPYR